MCMHSLGRPWRFLMPGILLLAVTGCPEKEEPAESSAAKVTLEAPVAVPTELTIDDKVKAKLVMADAIDGKEDKIVSKCATCALGMDGSAEYAVEVAGYKLHLCSALCKEKFEKDTTKAILAMEKPGE